MKTPFKKTSLSLPKKRTVINPYYIKRINKAIDYLESNLNQKLSLEDVARESMFSKYHFHRIFKAVTNETLNNYTKRLKLEKACRILVAKTDGSISDLAFKLGYQSVAGFSRDFQDFYGVSPSYVKKTALRPKERELKFDDDIELQFIEIKQIREQKVIYQRVASGYQPMEIRKAFQALYDFGQKNGILSHTSQVLGVGYDDPDFTPANKCRYDACIVVDVGFLLPADTPFNQKTIDGGKYAVFLFSGKAEAFHKAWDIIFKQWLLSSNYLPHDRPHFEMYLPSEHYEQGIFKAHLCLPIIELSS